MSLELNSSGEEKVQQLLKRKALILKGMIQKRVPVFTGQYKNLWSVRVNDDGSVSVVNPQGEKGRALEFGGGEGEFPPVNELIKWVDRKLPVPEDEVDQVAYLVGRKIERQGVNPQPHIRPAVREFKNREL